METDVVYERSPSPPLTKDQIYLKKFILLFKSLPELWDTEDPDYNNRYKRIHAYNKLVVVYKKFRVNASIDDVRKKINSLKSNFRKELRKVKEAKQSDTIYQPRSWVFHLLHFLDKENQTEASTETFEVEPASPEEEPIPINTIKYKRYSTSDECETPSVNQATNKVRKRRRDENHTTLIYDENNTSSISKTTDRDDEIFGEYITSVLRSFNSENCKKKLKRVIQRAIVDIQDEEDAMEVSYSRTRSSSE